MPINCESENSVRQNVFTIPNASSSVSPNDFHSVTLDKGQFELGEVKLKLRRHSAKGCMQSFQLLPAKVRQLIKLGTIIALLSTIAVVTLIFFYQLSNPTASNDISATDNNRDHFQGHDFNNDEQSEPISMIEENHSENESIQMKFYKDIKGKAISYDNLQIQPMTVHGHPREDVQKRQVMHPATAEEIYTTLEVVRHKVDQGRKTISSKELRLWEPGTEPMRILLVSTLSSGSTFLGSVIQSHPGVFQHYEPLSHFGIRQIRSGNDAFQSQQLIHKLLDCQYSEASDYLEYFRTNSRDMIGHNVNIYKPCKNGPNEFVCHNETFLSEACKLFPIQLVKTVRMRLNITQLLLNDEKLRAKVIFLVRDPRGVMSSRYSSVKWCSSSSDCDSPAVLCEDMRGDLKVAAAFQTLYPDRFISIKYEDLAKNPKEETLNLFSFLGLEFTEDTAKFIQDHTTSTSDKPWSTHKKSLELISQWKKLLPLEEIHKVQNSCKDVMKTLNYGTIGG